MVNGYKSIFVEVIFDLQTVHHLPLVLHFYINIY